MTSARELSEAILEASEVEIVKTLPTGENFSKISFFFKLVRFGSHHISAFYGLQSACRWYHPIVQLQLRIWIGSTSATVVKRPILEASEVEIGPIFFLIFLRLAVLASVAGPGSGLPL